MLVRIITYGWVSQTGAEIHLHTFNTGELPILYNSVDGAKLISRRDAALKLSMARSTRRFTRQEGRPHDI